jgi:hypothetical protein
MSELSICKRRMYLDINESEHMYTGFELKKENDRFYLTFKNPRRDALPHMVTYHIFYDYPFKPPHIEVDGNPYLQTVHYCHMPRIERLIKMIIPRHECFHCNFILNDWSPAMRISNIIHEIERINNLKRKVKYMLGLEGLNKFPDDLICHILSFIGV